MILVPDLDQLVLLFHASLAEVGEFREVTAMDLPAKYHRLLAHDHHMTVAMETFHQTPVELQVVHELGDNASYAREIVLRRATDGVPVQYGIVRIHWEFLPLSARGPIETQAAPLGRILIEQDVLRQVRLSQLWSIRPSPWLQEQLEDASGNEIFGRTAMIHCDGSPAIELLEIAS